MLGSGFHPEIVEHLGAWAGTFVLLPVFLLAAGTATFLFYRRVARYDPVTAFYCAAPGGLNEMVLLGGQAGGDERRIALAHAIRIFVSITLVALAFALFLDIRAARGGQSWVGFADLGARDLGILLLCAVAGSWGAARLRLPAAALFGPMILSAAVHLAGIVTLPPPTLLIIAAQVAIGTILGCRFLGADLRHTGRDMAYASGATVTMLAVTGVFAVVVHLATATATSQAVLAYSPGGLAEMSLLALAMEQDVAYVSTAHAARIVVVLFLTPLVFRLLSRRLMR
jgi:membrane AbrB-like protein